MTLQQELNKMKVKCPVCNKQLSRHEYNSAIGVQLVCEHCHTFKTQIQFHGNGETQIHISFENRQVNLQVFRYNRLTPEQQQAVEAFITAMR